jgi:LCP family protein required for cell wall assembly
VEEQKHERIDGLRSGIRRMVKELDTRTKTERAVDRAVGRIEHISGDEAFRAYLEKRDLTLDTEPREGSDHIYFDLLKPDGSRFGAFAVQKHSGEIYLVDSEDVVITSFSTLENRSSIPDTGEHDGDFALPDDLSRWGEAGTEAQGGRILLLCGVHEDNADTIMLAHLDQARIAILSLPRDLYYQKRKLTSYYQVYGPQELRRIVSEITGLEIDGYVSVDMYAFIEVIDILGGIEVELEEALIDPTYKVRIDGIWKTLYYPAGNHELGGVEALRIARSRHTSDDFDRSNRQQLIVEAIKEKLNELHAGNLKKLKSIFDTLFEYIDTNYSMVTAVRLFAEYHDVPVSPLSGASSDNILYATYSNLHRLDKQIEDVDEGFPKGAWILLPKEDNWQLIKWYVHEKFGMNGA